MTVRPSPRSGHLIILCGLPGAGKTTEAAARRRNDPTIVVLSADAWLIASNLSLWDSEARAVIEAAQRNLMVLLVQRGRTVIVEWGCWGEAEREDLRCAAAGSGASTELVHLDVGPDELWRRIITRRAEDPPIERRDLDTWVSNFQVPDPDEQRRYDRFERRCG